MEKVVVKKVSDFVTLINTLSLERTKLTITDFGKEVLARSGIMHLLESEQKVENETSKDYLEQVLAMMSSYEDECHRDMEEGLREEGDEPTIDEWMQNIMLQTDQDNDDDGNKVTLMTIHSAKGLEYDYIYIAGMEEGLFPSSRSVESLESIEEERRLMYVAITRAKKAAMLSFSETRRVWGKTENTQPSRFLKEIDTEYLDANFDIEELHGRNRWERMVEDRPQREKPSFEALRNRYDIRRGGQYSNRPAADRPKQSPNPDIITTPAPLDPRRAGMRSVGVRASDSATNGSASTSSTLGACAYKVGDRVSHPKFESGIIERIEPLSTDYKLVVKFDKFGSKTLLAKFAKLTKE